MTTRFIDPELIRSLLHYNPETGIFTWKPRPLEAFKTKRGYSIWNKRFANKRAGSVDNGSPNYQRRKIKIGSTYIKEHRLAWVYMTGEQPPKEIDHESRDGTDNRWVNLRDVNHAINSRNLTKRKRNTSGVTGVSWKKSMSKWRARCMVDYQEIHLGYFDDKTDAECAVKAFRAKHGFSDGHGTQMHKPIQAVVT
ncbi:HNH endonuclease [Halomonas sp. AOP31-B1-25]|uniref:HNH endonuclease n=1 Tax=Halomonas sp. AOP31-B1-25 TaxID=3457694 RepID=UPI004034D2E5